MTRTTRITTRISWVLLLNLAAHASAASVYSYSAKSGSTNIGSPLETSGLLLQDVSEREAEGVPPANGYELASSEVSYSERVSNDGSNQPSSWNTEATFTGVPSSVPGSSLAQLRDAYTSAARTYYSSYKPSSSSSQLFGNMLTRDGPMQSSYLPVLTNQNYSSSSGVPSDGSVYSFAKPNGAYSSPGTVATASYKPSISSSMQVTAVNPAQSSYQTDFSYDSTQRGDAYNSAATTYSSYQPVISRFKPTQSAHMQVSSLKPGQSNYETVFSAQNIDFDSSSSSVVSSGPVIANSRPGQSMYQPVQSLYGRNQNSYKPAASFEPLVTVVQPATPQASSQSGRNLYMILAKPTQIRQPVQDYGHSSFAGSVSFQSIQGTGFQQPFPKPSEGVLQSFQTTYKPTTSSKPLLAASHQLTSGSSSDSGYIISLDTTANKPSSVFKPYAQQTDAKPVQGSYQSSQTVGYDSSSSGITRVFGYRFTDPANAYSSSGTMDIPGTSKPAQMPGTIYRSSNGSMQVTPKPVQQDYQTGLLSSELTYGSASSGVASSGSGYGFPQSGTISSSADATYTSGSKPTKPGQGSYSVVQNNYIPVLSSYKPASQDVPQPAAATVQSSSQPERRPYVTPVKPLQPDNQPFYTRRTQVPSSFYAPASLQNSVLYPEQRSQTGTFNSLGTRHNFDPSPHSWYQATWSGQPGQYGYNPVLATKPVQSSIQNMPNQQPLSQFQGSAGSQSQYKPLQRYDLMAASQPSGSASASSFSDSATQSGQLMPSAPSGSTSYTLYKPTQTLPSALKPFQSGGNLFSSVVSQGSDSLYQQDKPMTVSEGCSDLSQDVSGFTQTGQLASESSSRPVQSFRPVSFTKPLRSAQVASMPGLAVNPTQNGYPSGSSYPYLSNVRRQSMVGNARPVSIQEAGSMYVQSGVSQDHGSSSDEVRRLSSTYGQGSSQKSWRY